MNYPRIRYPRDGHAGLRIRNKLMAGVFRKTLLLSSAALAEENAGRIVTLMSNDAQKVRKFPQFRPGNT